jgi:hypothetical protein
MAAGREAAVVNYMFYFPVHYIALSISKVKFLYNLQSATFLSETPILLVLPTGYCGLAGMILVNTGGIVSTAHGVFIYLFIYLFIYSV